MTADEIKRHYAAELKETIAVRRFTGTGASRAATDTEARGRAWGYSAKELIGAVQQGDQHVLLLADDLTAGGFELPVTMNDRVVIDGKEFAIMSPGVRKAPDGTLIAYELQVRG